MTAEPFHARELARRDVFDRRRADWRVGPIIYQVHVDRFAPSRRLPQKLEHYAPPRELRPWEQKPEPLPYQHDHLMSGAELQFWGGDLDSLRGRLDHVASLGVELLYLNPIFEAFSNHKYDATDYFRVDPQYGDADDLRALVDDAHGRGMKLMLDGVFNHMGRRSPLFQRELQEPQPPERGFFLIGPQHPNGWRGWRNVRNLPELNLENAAVRDYLWASQSSVVQHYLRDFGIDGWRLDVAPDLGFRWLAELRDAAHDARPGCSVIGECWNWPGEWLHVLDGVMNMFLRQFVLEFAGARTGARPLARALERLVAECPIEGLLQSHLVLDNHDVSRLATVIPQVDRRLLARALQFTLPGSPVVHHGSELGMTGGADPRNRAPMRWDLLKDGNPDLEAVRSLARLRAENPALRVGDCLVLDGDSVLAFLRTTDRATETILVAANAGEEPARERVAVRDSRLMDAAQLECLLTGATARLESGTVMLDVPPRTAQVLRSMDRGDGPGYSAFKRVM